MYIAASTNAVSSALFQEKDNTQQPIYFTSRIFQDPETRYHMIEKKPDLAGRLSSWAIELSEFNIRYEPHGPIKAQCLADFANDLQNQPPTQDTWWTIHVDGSSNPQGVGAGIVLEGPDDILVEQYLRFNFKTSNNQAEYEAIIIGLNLARDVGAKKLLCKTDSKLTMGHLNGEYQVKDTMLSQYYHTVTALIEHFEAFKIEHVPRSNNTRAVILSKLASTKKRGRYKSLLQHTLSVPSIEQNNQCLSITTTGTWMEPFVKYLEEGTTPANEDKGWAQKAARYTLIEGELFRRGFSRPLLKFITREQAEYVMQEIHQGICGYHSGPKTMAARILRARYFWPTMEGDCTTHVRKCV
ncbi:uncharacterized protein LOC114163480 [Vigna unguiculata]|uniref:uncharacterized protein LOC114163480 n=1 Tax=Vigna unguiculata TaxID=3917 RepID=UPI001016DAF1|nr:uncharacterized protein LOC114163480 [Vigna unguiculata]